MNGKEIRYLVESHERDGVFDDYRAAYDLVWEDCFTDDISRSLEIIAWAVRMYCIFDLVDGLDKNAAAWVLKFESQETPSRDVEEMLFLRPVHIFQLVKRLHTDWSKGIEDDLTR